jgi:hypothetical protein
VEVKVFVDEVNVFVEAPRTALVRSSGVLATPFTVVVRFVPERPKTFVLIIGTPVAFTPLTELVSEFSELVRVFVFTADVVAITPLIVEVIVFVGFVRVFVVEEVSSGKRFSELLATPLIVEVKFVPESPIVFVLIMLTEPKPKPLTSAESEFVFEVKNPELIILIGPAEIPLTKPEI